MLNKGLIYTSEVELYIVFINKNRSNSVLRVYLFNIYYERIKKVSSISCSRKKIFRQ